MTEETLVLVCQVHRPISLPPLCRVQPRTCWAWDFVVGIGKATNVCASLQGPNRMSLRDRGLVKLGYVSLMTFSYPLARFIVIHLLAIRPDYILSNLIGLETFCQTCLILTIAPIVTHTNTTIERV